MTEKQLAAFRAMLENGEERAQARYAEWVDNQELGVGRLTAISAARAESENYRHILNMLEEYTRA